MRKETDALGQMLVPKEAYYGIQTLRAVQNCNVSKMTFESLPEFITAVAQIKKAAALANKEIGALKADKADAIVLAADEVIAGKMKGNFPINFFRGGGGTPVNMNVNEVIAHRANEILTGEVSYSEIDPNTHVNMAQSTNDVIPTAMKLVAYRQLEELLAVLPPLEKSLEKKVAEFANVVKLGRTCLNDAVPLTLGQEFSAYLAMIKRNRKLLEYNLKSWTKGILGATAVGTGMGIMEGYIPAVYKHLSAIVGRKITPDDNFFDGMQSCDAFQHLSGLLKTFSQCLAKLAIDLRILSSGPRAGFGEITIPAVQPGSSIMPGKINPVMPELIVQISQQIAGNDMAITLACEMNELEICPWEPIITKNLAESFELLTKGIPLFVEKCIDGIKANEEQCRSYAETSASLSTMVAALFGYKAGSKVAKIAYKEGISVKEAVIREKILTKEEAEEIFDLKTLTDIDAMQRLLKKYQGRRTV